MERCELSGLIRTALAGSESDPRWPGRDPPLIADGVAAQRMRTFGSAFPDLVVSVQRLLIDGDLVAVHFSGTGTHRGIFQGCPPTGRVWHATGTAIFQLAHESIVRAWVTWDLLSILEQLGAIERSRNVSA